MNERHRWLTRTHAHLGSYDAMLNTQVEAHSHMRCPRTPCNRHEYMANVCACVRVLACVPSTIIHSCNARACVVSTNYNVVYLRAYITPSRHQCKYKTKITNTKKMPVSENICPVCTSFGFCLLYELVNNATNQCICCDATLLREIVHPSSRETLEMPVFATRY